MSKDNFKGDLFEQFARIGKALSNAGRLELIEYLAQSERSVEALAKISRLSVANASQHLQHLKRAGLVTFRKEGVTVFYRLTSPNVVRLLSAIEIVAEQQLADVEQLINKCLKTKDSLEAVPAEELLEWIKKGLVTIIDVRPPEEYESGHLPGAVNIPLSDLEGRINELQTGKEIIAYCRGPYCMLAFEAVARLRGSGIKARRLENGFPEWKLEGLPVEGSVE